MNHLDEKLYKYLGPDRTIYEPDGGGYEFYEVQDEPRIDDLHKMFASLKLDWNQDADFIYINPQENECIGLIRGYEYEIMYDSSKSLLQQSDATKEAIVKLFEEYETN